MDILRKRTFLEETASAKVAANSGETVIPEVADMIQGQTDALGKQSLILTLMNTPPSVPYQAYRVRRHLSSSSLDSIYSQKSQRDIPIAFLTTPSPLSHPAPPRPIQQLPSTTHFLSNFHLRFHSALQKALSPMGCTSSHHLLPPPQH